MVGIFSCAELNAVRSFSGQGMVPDNMLDQWSVVSGQVDNPCKLDNWIGRVTETQFLLRLERLAKSKPQTQAQVSSKDK